MSGRKEEAGAPVRVVTTDMAYGPHAVARHDGKVLFVRGAAPHEEIDARIREERKTFAFAEVASVVRPSNARRTPPCPYLPECGGCPWQHLTYEAQLRCKQTLVREQLRRLAGVAVPVEPVVASPGEYGYRQRLKLRVDNGRIGFYAGASHRLVPVGHCLLAAPEIDAAIPTLPRLLSALRTAVRRVEVTATGAAKGKVVVAGEAEGNWVPGDEDACRDWLQTNDNVDGLVLHGRRWRREWGDPRFRISPEDDLDLIVSAGTFTQVNPAANRLLVAAVTALVEPRPGREVLDLYAGAGNFSLPLARRGAVVCAVEQHPQAVADGRANAKRLGLETCQFIETSAKLAVERLLTENRTIAVALLDPPRSGAAGVLPALLELAPQKIVYVACDPSTLARDLKTLTARYRVETVRPFDLFPHSYHIETVVRATLE